MSPIGRKHREREKCVFLTNIFFSLPSRPSLARSNRPTLKVRASLAMQPLLLVYEAPKLKTDLISPRKTEQNKTRTRTHTQDFGTRHHSPILFLAVFSLSSDWWLPMLRTANGAWRRQELRSSNPHFLSQGSGVSTHPSACSGLAIREGKGTFRFTAAKRGWSQHKSYLALHHAFLLFEKKPWCTGRQNATERTNQFWVEGFSQLRSFSVSSSAVLSGPVFF